MELTAIPLLLFLVLPGFICINVGFLVSRFRRLSGFQGTAWSLTGSLVLFVTVYPVFTSIYQSQTGWPGLMDMLRDPRSVPGGLFAGLYISAPVVGWMGGQIVDSAGRAGIMSRLLQKIGVDTTKHSDIWDRMISPSSYIRVYLKDGDLLHGWSEYSSIGLTDHDQEIYLTKAFVWNTEKEDWVGLEDDTGILIGRSSISRIEILPPRE